MFLDLFNKKKKNETQEHLVTESYGNIQTPWGDIPEDVYRNAVMAAAQQYNSNNQINGYQEEEPLSYYQTRHINKETVKINSNEMDILTFCHYAPGGMTNFLRETYKDNPIGCYSKDAQDYLAGSADQNGNVIL